MKTTKSELAVVTFSVRLL